MIETDQIVLKRDRLPANVAVGSVVSLAVLGRVRRIEAEHLDISGYKPGGEREVAEGDVVVELTILDLTVLAEGAGA